MVRIALTMLLNLLFSCISFSQKVESLSSDEEVLAFIRSFKDYDKVFTVPPKPVYRISHYIKDEQRFGARGYEKADFDNNGYMDLLFNGYIDFHERNKTCHRLSLAIMSYGKDSFRVKVLTNQYHMDLFTTRAAVINGKTCVVTFDITEDYDARGKRMGMRKKNDTLAYVFDEFMEMSTPGNYDIQKISFCAGGGLGFFPIIRYVINPDSVVLNIEQMLGTIEPPLDSPGVFALAIDPTTRVKLFGMLNYINFPHLKANYAVRGTDAISGQMQIVYNDNRSKIIDDYGLCGTYGLAAFETLLIGLLENKQWKRIKAGPEDSIFCNF